MSNVSHIMSKINWKTYEEAARYLLEQFATEFNLGQVEDKQLVAGSSGTKWEIDAKAINQDGEQFLIVECKRWLNSTINQETLAGLSYRIIDTGASGGFIISPRKLQKGAILVAAHNNVVHIKMDKNSTKELIIAEFLGRINIAITDKVQISETVSIVLTDENGNITYNNSHNG